MHCKKTNGHHCLLPFANTLQSSCFSFLVNLKSLLMIGEKKGFIFVQKKNSVPTKMGHKGTHSFVYILNFSSLYKKDSLTLAY